MRFYKLTMPRILKRFAKADRGATAVEFAMVVGPFIFVLGAIIEVGAMMYMEYNIQAGVTEASRVIRTGQAQAAALKDVDFKVKVCESAKITDCSKLTVYVKPATTFAALKTELPSFLDIGKMPNGQPSAPQYGCGAPLNAVGIVATYDWTIQMPFLSMFGNVFGNTVRRLHGVAIFRNEPFPSGGSTC